ncbi:hypothetical protein BC829DRAFT_486543 [Chytridium lagenaria]|nr:hypothetical protein BC829DRAFT_486543 [Chytridium lagenaria]
MPKTPVPTVKITWQTPKNDMILAKQLSECDNPPWTGARLREAVPYFAAWSPKTLSNKIRSARKKLNNKDHPWPSEEDLAEIEVPLKGSRPASSRPMALSGLQRSDQTPRAQSPPPSYSSAKGGPPKRPVFHEDYDTDDTEVGNELDSDPVVPGLEPTTAAATKAMEKYRLPKIRKMPVETTLRLHEIVRYEHKGRFYCEIIIRFIAGFDFEYKVLDGGKYFEYDMRCRLTSKDDFDPTNSPIMSDAEEFAQPICAAVHRYFPDDRTVDNFKYSFALPEPIDSTCQLERKIYTTSKMRSAKAEGLSEVQYPFAVGLSFQIAGQTIKANKRARSSMA